MDALFIPLALVVGGLLALQAAANLQLSRTVGSPVGASTIQLGIAAVLLTLVAGLGGTLAALERLPAAEPWHLLGGLGSAIYITAGILLFPRLGALASVALFVAGQMLASVLMDGLGLVGVERIGFGVTPLAGTAAVLAGMAVVVRAQAGAGGAAVTPRPRSRGISGRGGWVLLGLLAGAALPLQGAVNAQLRLDLGAPFTVGAFSFVVSTATMAAVLLCVFALGGAPRPRVAPLRTMPWWGWLGGLVGASYVVTVFLLLPEIGAAATIGLTLAGQQVASLLVDHFGWLRLPRRPLTTARLAGVLVLLAGVALVQLT